MLLFASFHDSLLQIAQSIKRCLFSATQFSALRFFFQTIVVLGIFTVQIFRDEMILFSTNFHFFMILFSSGIGGKGSDLEMALGRRAVCWLLFYKWSALLQLQLTQERRGRGLLCRSLNLPASLAEQLPGQMEILFIWEKLPSLKLI